MKATLLLELHDPSNVEQEPVSSQSLSHHTEPQYVLPQLKRSVVHAFEGKARLDPSCSEKAQRKVSLGGSSLSI